MQAYKSSFVCNDRLPEKLLRLNYKDSYKTTDFPEQIKSSIYEQNTK